MNKTVSTIGSVVARIGATFVYQAMAVIGGASIVGGIPVYKAALLSGLTATATVIQKITMEELDSAFRMNSAPSSQEKQNE